jgi:hypothetical protein
VTAGEAGVAGDSRSIARAIASDGLFPDNERALRAAPVDWADLLSLLAAQRLCGFAVRAVDAGWLDLASDQYGDLLDFHEMQLALDLRIERVAQVCVDALSNARIDVRLLKGPATSHRFYEDPALRSFGDADILVRPTDFRAAIRVVRGLGFSRKTEPPRSWFDRYVKAVCLLAGDGLEVDLHQTLAPGPYGVIIESDALFRVQPDRVLIGQRKIACLPPAVAFIHACVHAVLGDPYPRFVSLRDVVEILRGGLDECEVTQLAARWQLQPVVSRALFLAEAVLGGRLEDPIFDRYMSYRPSRRDQWRLRAYAKDGPRFARQSAATLWELTSIKDKAAYGLALALPNRHYLRTRKTSYAARIRRGVALARIWRPR